MPDQKLGIAVGADVLEKGPGDLAEVDVWACQHGAGVRERKETSRGRASGRRTATVGTPARSSPSVSQSARTNASKR